MDACSSYKYGSNIGLERLIKKYFCQHHNITIIIKGESETCPISEIAIIILFIGSFEAEAFSFTNLFFSRPAVLVCFLAVLPFVAFPILLQQLQEKTRSEKNYLRFERNAKH